MIPEKILAEIIESQREKILNAEKGILRENLEEFKLRKGSALIISGIRRCGKSTLLRQLLAQNKDFYYLNLEDPRLEGFDLIDFNRANDIFEQGYGSEGIYFFDEIQNVDKWEKFIRFLADRKKTIVITGSNASLLSRELGTRLTGRHISHELFPFSYKEFLEFHKIKPSIESYEKYLFLGGFPEFLEDNDDYYLNEILSSVIMRDIAIRYGIKNATTLKKLAIYLVTHVGKEFSYNSLKKTFEVGSVRSIIDYISYFEDAYLVFTIPQFSYSYKKQQVNPKKVYSIDNGLSYVNSVSFSKDKGKMLENNVFLHLRRKYKEIFYFQNNNECDFIVKYKEKIVQAIQVCYDFNRENQDREINGLVEALKKFKLDEGLILTYNQDDYFEIQGKKIILKPVWKWMIEGSK
ncbi:MAG: ATP-binding protein [Candidatus Nanoarchaeia archaeon]